MEDIIIIGDGRTIGKTEMMLACERLALSGVSIADLQEATRLLGRGVREYQKIQELAENFKKACADLSASGQKLKNSNLVEKHCADPNSRKYKIARR